MLETVGNKQGMLWAQEIYKPFEIIELGFNVVELLENGKAKWWIDKEGDEK